MLKKSKRCFDVQTDAGVFSFKVPAYDKLFPLIQWIQDNLKSLVPNGELTEDDKEVDQTKNFAYITTLFEIVKKLVPLFWNDKRSLDSDDVIGSLQDMDLELADMSVIIQHLVEKTFGQANIVEKAEEVKNA